MPSSPNTIVSIRSTERHVLKQWWAVAKRYVFRSWPYLLNSHTGVFLVTKCVKTHRYAECLSKGRQGQLTQVRIHGLASIPQNADNVALPVNGTTWVAGRNDLGFNFHEVGGGAEYTIFIDRDASRMFTLTDVSLRDAAQKLWTYFGP
jgi:hypothetical protein